MTGLDLLFVDHGRLPSRKLRVIRAGVAFALAGLPLVVAAFLVLHNDRIRSRPIVSCTIVDSGVDSIGESPQRERPYHVSVSFSFEFEHRPGVGHRLMNDFGGSSDAAAAYAQAARYVPGSIGRCAVDPANLDDAVLVTDKSLAEQLAVPLAAAGLAAIALFYCLPQLRLAIAPATVAVPALPEGRRTSGIVAAIFLIVAFGFVTLDYAIVPLFHTTEARSWPAVPCRIESSNVQREELRGELPITLYRTDVLYSYFINAIQYHSNCYRFTECSSPAAGGRIRVAGRFATGQSAVCFVDPNDPTSSELSRHISVTASFALLPLSFVLVGLLVLLSRWNNKQTRSILRQNKWTFASVVVAATALMILGIFMTP